MAARFQFHLFGFRACCTPMLRNVETGGELGAAKGFTGPPSMKTLVSRDLSWGNRRERVRNPLNGGWTVEASSAADDLEPAQQAPGKRLRQPTWKLQLCGERRIPGNHS